MEKGKILRHHAIEEAGCFVNDAASGSGFNGEAEIIEAMRILVALRAALRDPESLEELRSTEALETRATQLFHQRLRACDPSLPVIRLFERHGLDPLERELLLFLVASTLGIVSAAADMEDVQIAMRKHGAERLQIARAFTEEGRLASTGLISLDDEDDLLHRPAAVSPEVIAPFLGCDGREYEGFDVQSQDQLLERCFPLFSKLRERAASLENSFGRFFHSRSSVEAINRRIDRLARALWATFERHPQWPLSQTRWKLNRQETEMIVALIGKDLGFCDCDDELFLGEGLARAASSEPPQVRENLASLRRDRILRREGYVRICGGYGDSQAFDDESTLRTCEFELTGEFRKSVGIDKRSRHLRTRHRVRTPAVRLDQLVLSSKVADGLRMIIAQVRESHLLMDTWGFKDVLSYGHGVTALFAGPPGVGKTACAEAMAHELGKPILTANYAEIENCWVGETEKNIGRVFKDAADADAVLFWDETDAMLYDRDAAYRSWEVRQVNVLLEQLERFGGVCIMATNRKLALDRALERRIAVKLEFDRPGPEMRRQIWRKHLPPAMPLAPDVNLDRLARVDLTGGEIKNAVLNAARITLARDPRGPVAMADFEQAIEMELHGRWNRDEDRPIGFRR